MNLVEPEYEPVDLTTAYNAGADLLEDPEEITLGDRELYGLPFRFGTPASALVKASPGDPQTVTLGGSATWLVFAHAVLEPDLYFGGYPGEPVGRYVVRYEDGTEVLAPLLQRFEIGPTPRKWSEHPIPLDWGQTPFLAVNGVGYELMDRVHGRFDEAGARLVEIKDPQSRVPYVLPYRFYIWSWRNQHPDKNLDSISLVPGERHTLLLAALTRSRLEEEPITRNVAREMIIRLHGEGIDENVSVTVDRGYATYVYLLPPSDNADSKGTPGWGRDRDRSDVGYTRITCSPSATVSISRNRTTLGTFRWSDLEGKGSLRISERVTVELPTADRVWITGEVRDADTDEPVPCRIRFQSADGIPFAPYSHHTHINSDGGTWNLDIGGDVRLGSDSYAFIDGLFEGWVPEGALTVEAARGFTYEPIRQQVTIGPERRHVVLYLKRRFNPAGRGYSGGDTHIHFVSTKGAEIEARAEDLQVANLLQSQWGHVFTSTEEFSGRSEYSTDGQTVVVTGQENRTNMLGHINLLGPRRPILPWCTGGPEEAELGGGMDTTLSHWADECHAQGGLVVLAHFPVPYGEAAALLATDRVDAIETIAYDEYNLNEYYRFLNTGFQLPLAAGTDKMTAEVPIGLMRTYAAVTDPSRADFEAWADGIRNGRTMVSSGPMLWLSTREAGDCVGSTLQVPSGGSLELEIQLETIFPVESVEVLVNGSVTTRLPVPCEPGSFNLRHQVEIKEDSWVATRCFGAQPTAHFDTWRRRVFAHTSPVYITTGDRYERLVPETIGHLQAIVAGARRHILERARTRWPGRATHRHGPGDHLDFLTAPFDEAERTLRQRLEDHNSTEGEQ